MLPGSCDPGIFFDCALYMSFLIREVSKGTKTCNLTTLLQEYTDESLKHSRGMHIAYPDLKDIYETFALT